MRGVARLLAAVGIACAATVLASVGTATAGTTTPSPSPDVPDSARPARVVDRVVRDDRVQEASGLVVSRTLDGVLWTFNDSGGTPDLFGIGRDGSVVARLRVKDADNVDWESAAPVRLLDGTPAVAIGDTGDNRLKHDHATVYVVAEPTNAGTTKRAPVRTITLTYPDGPVDAEALFCDPRTNRLYLVSKGLFGGRLYAVPPEVWPGGRSAGRTASAELQALGRVPLVLVTDAVGLPDGRVALRTYGDLAIMPPVPADDEAVWSPLATTLLPRQGQGESIALARSRTSFFLGTEGANKPILQFTPPADVMAARPAGAPATSSAGATASPGATGGTAAQAGGSGGSSGGGVDGLFLAGAGVVGVLAAGAAAAAVRRRR